MPRRTKSLKSSKLDRVGSKLPMQFQSTITCPHCDHQTVKTMPADACLFFYDCQGCGNRLKPKAGDCCVFCSFGSVPCPPVQSGDCCS
jgi:hypothetical protein